MSGVPRIAIEQTAVNDIVVLLDAVLPGDDVALGLEDPAALYVRYRAELRLFRQLMIPEPEPVPHAPRRPRGGASRLRLSGSILR